MNYFSAPASIFARQVATRKRMETKMPDIHANSEEIEYKQYKRFFHISQASELSEDFLSENSAEHTQRGKSKTYSC